MIPEPPYKFQRELRAFSRVQIQRRDLCAVFSTFSQGRTPVDGNDASVMAAPNLASCCRRNGHDRHTTKKAGPTSGIRPVILKLRSIRCGSLRRRPRPRLPSWLHSVWDAHGWCCESLPQSLRASYPGSIRQSFQWHRHRRCAHR
jgi:hypothetical protein